MPNPQLTTLRGIHKIFRSTGVSLWWFVPAILLSLTAAVFEGAQMGLLIPFLEGFLSQDYSFLKETPYLSDVIKFMPDWISSRDRTLLGFLLGLIVLSVILKNVFKYGAVVAMSFLSTRVLHHLRKALFARYMSFGKLYFDTSNIGHHTVVLSEFARNALKPLLVSDRFINAFFSLLGYLVVMTFISWKLTLFALPLFAILHFSIQALISIIRRISHSLAKKVSELSKRAIEVLTSMPLVKSYNMERKEFDRYRVISDHYSKLEFRMTAVQQFISPFHEILTMMSLLLLTILILYLMVAEHRADASSFIIYLYLVRNSASKFGFLTNFRSYVADSSGPVSRVIDILSDEKKYYVPSGENEFSGLTQSIQFKDLSFDFPGGKSVLKDLSFKIEKGKMTAIVGPTGAGKTTIINLLLRFYDSNPDSILFDGTDMRTYTTASLRDHMALVSQDTLLLNDSLKNNVAYGLEDVNDDQVREVVEKARLQEFISTLPQGLDTVIGDRGVRLSGGEKQRVSIARALLKGAEILILDEATSSLDTETERQIQDAIDEAIKDRTAIVIAHRLSTIKNADKIVVIEDGRCTEEGTLDELIAKKGKFFGLWEGQKFG
jgi:subfamily B ATP-binding cassette protein MsbA